ncbi:zinc transporter ZIP9 isoform X1 [Oncorhynchus nerka]|uniref:zinc transporter ZIP9 isoform X1 n=1 Tax=Oncorhynchus nerka TaxID=8023 RepID=UPI0031B87FFB
MSMDDFTSISLLSLAMLVGCYVAGTIPLAVNFSEEKLKLVTVLGAGLLCGTALAVIIPEGVHALYEEVLEGVHHAPGQVEGVEVSQPKEGVDAALGVSREHSHDHLHAYIGVSLVLGFVFMLLVDQIGSAHVHTSADDPESARVASSKITTTLGLVVHAAADGVALGAAASTSQTSVQLIVFVAIMLHKVQLPPLRPVFSSLSLWPSCFTRYSFHLSDQCSAHCLCGHHASQGTASTSQTSVQLIVFVAIMLHKVQLPPLRPVFSSLSLWPSCFTRYSFHLSDQCSAHCLCGHHASQGTASTSQTSVQLIVFVAIMLHKVQLPPLRPVFSSLSLWPSCFTRYSFHLSDQCSAHCLCGHHASQGTASTSQTSVQLIVFVAIMLHKVQLPPLRPVFSSLSLWPSCFTRYSFHLSDQCSAHCLCGHHASQGTASTSQTSVQLIVFVAIMLHKVQLPPLRPVFSSLSLWPSCFTRYSFHLSDQCSAHCLCGHHASQGPSSLWPGLFPDACWSREESDP